MQVFAWPPNERPTDFLVTLVSACLLCAHYRPSVNEPGALVNPHGVTTRTTLLALAIPALP